MEWWKLKSEYLTVFDVQEQNWVWFKKNYSRLVRKFDGEYVAVFESRVVDHDRDMGRLARRIREKFPFDRVLVKFVSKEKVVLVL